MRVASESFLPGALLGASKLLLRIGWLQSWSWPTEGFSWDGNGPTAVKASVEWAAGRQSRF